jgi:hypothetical protein
MISCARRVSATLWRDKPATACTMRVSVLGVEQSFDVGVLQPTGYSDHRLQLVHALAHSVPY